MMDAFKVSGTEVKLQALLQLKTLAVDLQAIKAPPTRSSRIGEQRSKFRGQGREFIEMKHYQTGDDVRQIDWRQTAKKQTPFVRVMEEDRHSEHVIWLALTPRLFFGTKQCFKSVLACHWAAFLIWRFIKLKHPVRLVIEAGQDYQKTFVVRSAKHGAHACQLICDAHQFLTENFQTISAIKEAEFPHWSGHPHVWVLSDFLDNSLTRIEQALTMQPASSLSCLQTLDAFDQQLPNVGALPVKDKNQSGWIRTQDAIFQQAHKQSFNQAQQQLEQLCWQFYGLHRAHYTHQFNWQEVQTWPLYQ